MQLCCKTDRGIMIKVKKKKDNGVLNFATKKLALIIKIHIKLVCRNKISNLGVTNDFTDYNFGAKTV